MADKNNNNVRNIVPQAKNNCTTVNNHTRRTDWLQLPVCQDFLLNKCNQEHTKECHPPPFLNRLQGSVVICCYDHMRERCKRSEHMCRFYHPTQSQTDFIMIRGRQLKLMGLLNQITSCPDQHQFQELNVKLSNLLLKPAMLHACKDLVDVEHSRVIAVQQTYFNAMGTQNYPDNQQWQGSNNYLTLQSFPYYHSNNSPTFCFENNFNSFN